MENDNSYRRKKKNKLKLGNRYERRITDLIAKYVYTKAKQRKLVLIK